MASPFALGPGEQLSGREGSIEFADFLIHKHFSSKLEVRNNLGKEPECQQCLAFVEASIQIDHPHP